MKIVTDCWQATTGEVLRPTGPTALFGDRHHGRLEEDVQQYKHLEEPWRALHAATVIALDEARRHTMLKSAKCSRLETPFRRRNVRSGFQHFASRSRPFSPFRGRVTKYMVRGCAGFPR